MRQLMKTRVLALASIPPVVRADLHPPLSGISMAAPPAAHDDHRVGICRERSREPVHVLDGMDVRRALPKANQSVMLHEQGVC